jgi:hypothetical protein
MPPDPQFPPNFKDTIQDTRDLVDKLIDRAASVAGAAGKKWIDGFTKQDATDVAVDVGEKFKDQVLDAWDVADKEVADKKGADKEVKP